MILGPRLLDTFTVFDVDDPADMDSASRVSQRFPSSNNVNTYVLRDRALHRRPPLGLPLTRLAMRPVGDLLTAYVSDRHGTEVGIVGAGAARFCLTFMLRGGLALEVGGTEVHAAADRQRGVVYRGDPGTRLLTSDGNARLNVWVAADRVERTLQGLLDQPLRQKLAFTTPVDWSAGLGASLHGMVGLFTTELTRADGIASNTVALNVFTDLLVQTMLQGLPHNHTDRLQTRTSDPMPRHLRRADEYMRVHADAAMVLQDVADAAGCSLRSLHDAFRRFRGTTPLAALHGIRLDAARNAIIGSADGEASVAEVARRFGFTNRARFIAAYASRFGNLPPGAKRRS